MADTNLEILMQKLINGETIEDYEARSRLEEHLLACINKTGADDLGTPRSVAEALLQVLAEQIQEGGGAKLETEIDTENALLLLDGAEVVGNTLVLPKGSASVEDDTLIIN